MRAWLRVILPPEQYVVPAILLYAVATGVPLLISGANGLPIVFPLRENVGMLVLLVAAVAFGIYRVQRFHPVCSKEYREWLGQTPWNVNLPLPLGPVHLVLQDVLVVGALTGLSFLHAELHPLEMTAMFLAAYLVTLTACLALTQKYAHAYFCAILLGLALYRSGSIPEAVGVLSLACTVSYDGLQRSLRDFAEWDLGYYENHPQLQFNQHKTLEMKRQQLLGWPFDRIGPQRNRWPVNVGHALAGAVLLGWWSFVVLSLLPEHARGGVMMIATMAAMFAAGRRLFLYVWGYLPPLNLWGRIATFRWIIPRYDVVFVGPALAVAWTVGAVWLVFAHRVPPIVVIPLQLSGTLLIVLLCPPSLDQWRLTGNHRITAATSQQASELQETR